MKAARTSSLPRLAPLGRFVASGLTRRPGVLPGWLFQDARGRQLFAELTRSPEHYGARTQAALVDENAHAIAREAGAEVALVELDADGGQRADALRAALLERQRWLHYIPVAASEAELGASVERVAGRTPSLEIEPRRADFLQSVRFLASLPSPRLVAAVTPRMGELGAADTVAELRAMRSVSSTLDTLLLAFDLASAPDALCAAYDTADGAGARFGLHALERLNRELGADFALDAWVHDVSWNASHSRVELRLRAKTRQRVFVDALGLPLLFEPGDLIETASFHKPDVDGIDRLLFAGGFARRALWRDADERCAVVLAAAQ
ncbi:MAG: L-histidine N(alpha)-methyltransferase [Myxococcota bacterium]